MTSMDARLGDATRTVPLPNPWDLSAYLAAVAAHRGRSITLHTAPRAVLHEIGCGAGGLWVARTHDDIIVYDDEAIERNVDHLVLHQVGHMLLEHGERQDRPDPLPPSLAVLLPTMSPRSIEHALGRGDFGEEREREAEVFADMTMVYATLPRRRARSFRLFGRGR
ncbi:hypothetical protein [Nocardia brasiliensis]|nr:hypothetical protein [Nocardia brasiliensis]